MKAVPKSSLHRFCPKSAAISFGIVWGVLILLTGWVAMTGWGSLFVNTLSSIYTGYCASFIGGIIGGIWGFFYGAVVGFGFSWIYNRALEKR